LPSKRKTIRILAVGDIVGRPGRQAVSRIVPFLREELEIGMVLANAENAAGGSGVTPPVAEELLSAGVDVLTSGDHIWKKREIVAYLGGKRPLFRPANYPEGTPGSGAGTIKTVSGLTVGVINLVGRVFMSSVECPFRVARAELEKLKKTTPLVIVDMHAEATSEKIAIGRFLDGRASAVLGTHTHVQTADEKILPRGTAYISDLGMTGPLDSVLGRRTEQIIERFLTGLPVRFEMATDDVELQGAVVEIDAESGRAISIERIRRKLEG
jgi:metallophosphoesterase (TIGR00282 family)